MSLFKTISGLLLAAVLTACGGGGGESGTAAGSSGSSSSGSTSGSGSTSSSTTTTSAPSLLLALQNASNSAVSGIDVAGTYQIKAALKDASGAPIVDTLVTFSLSSSLATLSQSTALTDHTTGIATISIAPTAGAPSGAAKLTATSNVSNATVTGTIDFSSTGAVASSGATILASLVDSGGVAVTSIGASGYKAKVLLRDGTGAPISGKLVNFSLNTSSASLTSSTALTLSDGTATVGISSITGSSAGAATLTASATVSGASLSSSTDFAFSGATVSLVNFVANSLNLTSGGNTSLSIDAQIGGLSAGSTPVNITFTASCGSINGAIGSVGVTTNGSGNATANYSAVQSDGTPCAGSVTIGATTGAVSANPLTVTVANPVASSVAYVGATLSQIYVTGSGAPTDSVLTFKVLTATGALSTNTQVAFTIPTNTIGASLNTASGTTDNAGLVTVKASSGAIPGPLKVRATIAGGAYSESQNLTVASGPPSQRYMSVSLSTFNVEGENIDGTPTTITARLADRQGNPVQDGTVVNFTASGGQVASSCATSKINGIAQCSVLWQSQAPRPTNGRVAVMAYTVGTKDYTDNNSNNVFDAGVDTLIQLGDLYRDDNENGVYSPSTDGFFLSVAGTGTAVACASAGEPAPSTGSCYSQLETIVRQQVIIVNSSTHPEPISGANLTNVSTGGFNVTLRSIDHHNLPLPAGTLVTASFASGSANCSVTSVTPSTVGNISPGTVTNAVYPDLSTTHSVNLKTCASNDKITVTVTPPSGVGSSYSTTISLP